MIRILKDWAMIFGLSAFFDQNLVFLKGLCPPKNEN